MALTRPLLPIASLALALALLGCSAPPPRPTPTAPAATQPPATPAPSPSPAPTVRPTSTPPPSPTADSRSLLVWAVVGDDAERDATLALLQDAFRAQGVEATVVPKTPDALSADVVAGPQAGLRPPDVIWGGADDLFLLQRAGAIQPAGDGLDEQAFLPAAIEGASVGGERWGTPVAARGFLLLLYNKKLAPTAPATAEDLAAQARRLSGGGRAGLVAGWVESRWLEAWLRGFGGASLGPDGAPSLDTPEMVSALTLLKALRAGGPPPPSTYAEGAKLFRDGRAAFAIDGDWALARYRAYTDTLDLGYAPLPTVGPLGRPALAPLEGVYLMYGAQLGGARLDAARRAGAALSAAPMQERVARELHHLPALRAALGSAAVAGDPALAAAAQRAPFAPGIPPAAALRCAWDAGEGVLPALLLGDIDPPEAARRLQERASACAAAP